MTSGRGHVGPLVNVRVRRGRLDGDRVGGRIGDHQPRLASAGVVGQHLLRLRPLLRRHRKLQPGRQPVEAETNSREQIKRSTLGAREQMHPRVPVPDARTERGVGHRDRRQTELPRLQRVGVIVLRDRLDKAVLRLPQMLPKQAHVLALLRTEPPKTTPGTKRVRSIVTGQPAKQSQVAGIGKRRQRVGAQREGLGLRIVREPTRRELPTCTRYVRRKDAAQMRRAIDVHRAQHLRLPALPAARDPHKRLVRNIVKERGVVISLQTNRADLQRACAINQHQKLRITVRRAHPALEGRL
jgi:hypothetical protein